jgi:hypothetical protein
LNLLLARSSVPALRAALARSSDVPPAWPMPRAPSAAVCVRERVDELLADGRAALLAGRLLGLGRGLRALRALLAGLLLHDAAADGAAGLRAEQGAHRAAGAAPPAPPSAVNIRGTVAPPPPISGPHRVVDRELNNSNGNGPSRVIVGAVVPSLRHPRR